MVTERVVMLQEERIVKYEVPLGMQTNSEISSMGLGYTWCVYSYLVFVLYLLTWFDKMCILVVDGYVILIKHLYVLLYCPGST